MRRVRENVNIHRKDACEKVRRTRGIPLRSLKSREYEKPIFSHSHRRWRKGTGRQGMISGLKGANSIICLEKCSKSLREKGRQELEFYYSIVNYGAIIGGRVKYRYRKKDQLGSRREI